MRGARQVLSADLIAQTKPTVCILYSRARTSMEEAGTDDFHISEVDVEEDQARLLDGYKAGWTRQA